MNGTLVKNFSLYAIGQFLTQILSLLLLPVYLKYLSVEEYGIVASLMAVATFLNALMQFGASPTIMRFYYDYKEEPGRFNGFFSSVLGFILIANLFILVVLYAWGDLLFALILPDINIEPYLIFILLYSFCFAIPILNLALFRIHGKPLKFLAFTGSQFLFSFVAIFYLVVIEDKGALGKIEGEFWSRLPLFILGFIFFRKYLALSKINLKDIGGALKFGLPLMAQSLIWWALYKMDYFLIGHVLGNEGVGLYNVGFQVSYVLITLGISFSLAWTPHFFAVANRPNTPRVYGNLICHFLLALIICGSILLMFIKDGLLFLNAESYYPTLLFLPFLVLGAIFQSGYYVVQQLLMYAKKTIYIPVVLVFGLVISLAGEYWALQFSGLIGLSVAKAIGFVLIFVLALFLGSRWYDLVFSRKKIIFLLANLIGASGVIFIGDLMHRDWHIAKGAFILINILAIYMFYLSASDRNALKAFLKQVS